MGLKNVTSARQATFYSTKRLARIVTQVQTNSSVRHVMTKTIVINAQLDTGMNSVHARSVMLRRAQNATQRRVNARNAKKASTSKLMDLARLALLLVRYAKAPIHASSATQACMS